MLTQLQKKKLYQDLKTYKSKYLRKKYSDLDESATRIMINYLLTEVFGYIELEEIKTEYRIRGEYADYVIQLERSKKIIVEVKSIQLDLSEKHLRQGVNYASNEGIDWIVLTNGKDLELYKIIFGKPITYKQIFKIDLSDLNEVKNSLDLLGYLTKKSLLKKDLDKFWKKFQALSPEKLSKNLYSLEVINFLRRKLRQQTGLLFSKEDILDSVHQTIITKIESKKPNKPL